MPTVSVAALITFHLLRKYHSLACIKTASIKIQILKCDPYKVCHITWVYVVSNVLAFMQDITQFFKHAGKHVICNRFFLLDSAYVACIELYFPLAHSECANRHVHGVYHNIKFYVFNVIFCFWKKYKYICVYTYTYISIYIIYIYIYYTEKIH